MVNPVVTIVRDRLAAWLGQTHAGARNLYEQFGWTQVLRVEQLASMYLRNGIANRIIKLYPQATWREQPIIRDEQGSSPEQGKPSYSPFVEAVDALFKKTRMFHFLERGDRVASIGQFGCLLLGFADGKPASEPLEAGNHKLLYVQPYGQLNVTVNRVDDNPQSSRFGKPLLYTLQTADLAFGQGATAQHRSIVAHWTRVIHIAEQLDEDNVYGVPRLFPIYNYLQDLDKVLGASTETFWLNARAGLSIEADKDATITDAQLAAAREQAQEYEHQLRRILALQGMRANQLNSEVADPSMTVGGLMDMVSGGSGIPKRILLGSERGELASSQDENNWAQRTEERRKSFAMPMVLEPLVTVLIHTGNLPPPQGEWWVDWGGKALTPEQQAAIGAQMSSTLRNYLSTPGADLLVPPTEFRSQFMGLTPQPEVDEESGFNNVLEDEREKMAEEQAALAGKPKADGDGADPDGDGADPDGKPRLKVNTRVAPLYVYRPVLNPEALLAWAKDQGFSSLLPASDLHVTVLYSRSAVDWLKMGADDWNSEEGGRLTVKPGGPRIVEQFGDATVVSFAHSGLAWRHEQLKQKGASSDHNPYCPHISLTYNGRGDLDLLEIEPYTGEIVLGPERFEEINPNWQLEIVEDEL